MNADEIRAKINEIDGGEELGRDRVWCAALLEIAAQLAELNTKLDRLTAPTNEPVRSVIGVRNA